MSKEDTTVIQRVLSSSALALESTMIRLRRLKKDELPESSSSRDATADQLARETAEKAGRIEHDSRGSAVWNWAVETGTSALENTQRLLKRLETPTLTLDEKPSKPEPRDSGSGYDPYNRDKPSRKR